MRTMTKFFNFNFFKILFIILLSSIIIPNTVSKYALITSPVLIKYDYFNSLKQISIRFRPQTTIFKQDIIFLSFSQQLQTIPGNIGFNLWSDSGKQYANGLFSFITQTNIAIFNLNSFKNNVNSSYTCEIKYQQWYLTSNRIQSEWLVLVLKFKTDLPHIFTKYLGSVNIAFFSSFDMNHVDYQSMNGFSYFYFASLTSVAPPQIIQAQIVNDFYGKSNYEKVLNNRPGIIHPIYLRLIPKIQYTNIDINIQFTLSTLTNLTSKILIPPSLKSFLFQGTCSFLCQNTTKCFIYSTCKVTYDKIKISISPLQKMIINETYVIKLSVLNPPYFDSTNLLVWVDDEGSGKDMANIVGSLTTKTIDIVEDQLKLLWRIPQIIVNNSMGLGFFVNGGLNTVQVGFNISDPSPFGQTLEFIVFIGSDQLILQSINHNLPSVNTTIYFQFIAPYLTIKNVSALSKTGYRYWISFRTKYLSPGPYSLDSIGSIDIKLKNYPNQVLFVPLVVSRPKKTILYSDYHDYTGFNNPLTSKNYDTMIVSAMDNGLQNATGQGIRKYFNQNYTVGIDPTIQNQQLLFLMNVLQSQMSINTNQTYQTRIFVNPNIFKSLSNKGLQVVALNVSTQTWSVKHNDCYQDQTSTPLIQTFMCQKYNDHVWDYQFDNTFNDTSSSFYSFYNFVCGNGSKIQCLGTTCKSQCRLFKGFGMTTGSSGIAAIRNVTFIPSYQSPIQASDKNLDFIISFYQGGVFISATIINAYTVKPNPLTEISLSLINTYHDGTLYNVGDKIPTLLKITGKLTYTQIANLKYPNKIKIYLPPKSININNFLQNSNNIGCSYKCKFNQSHLISDLNPSQNWQTMSVLTVENLPTLTNKLNILIPIQIIQNLLSVYIGFQSNGTLTGIYRISGSAVNQSTKGSLTYFYKNETYTLKWDTISPWTISTAYTFTPKVNLEQTNFTSTQTLISMNNSVMPYYNSPYLTISIMNIDILTDSTTILVGNTNINRTCQKLFYKFNLKNLQLILCQMFTNVNTTTNNIKILYPNYDIQNWLGSGFPYDKLFFYAYASDITGKLEGFQHERGNKLGVTICSTSKATQYNLAEVGRQLEIFKFQIEPILLSAATYMKIQLAIQLPNNIQSLSCIVKETIFFQPISCIVKSKINNITTYQLSILPTQTVQLLRFELHVSCYESATVVVPVNTKYKVQVKLPHTDALNLTTIYGISFIPYSSIAYACSNLYNAIVSPYSSFSLIQSHILNAVAINLNTQLSFNISFNKQKGDLIENHIIQLQFIQMQVTQNTYCDFKNYPHQFFKRTFVNNKYILHNDQVLSDFPKNTQQVFCSNLILKGTAPQLIVRVIDVPITPVGTTVILLSNVYPLTYKLPYSTLLSTLPFTAMTAIKKYSSLGFNAQQNFTFTISGAGLIGLVQGYIDLSQFQVDHRILRCQLATTGQQIFCRKHKIQTVAKYESRSNIVYFKIYFPTSVTSFSIIIYPILQEKFLAAANIKFFLVMNQTGFYANLIDKIPASVVKNPILISSYGLTPVIKPNEVLFDLNIIYKFPLSTDLPLYIQIPQSIFLITLIGAFPLTCSVNSTIVPCTILQKDLIKIDITGHIQTLNVSYSLLISSLKPNYQIYLYDPQHFFIRMFIVNSATFKVDYVSYIGKQLFESALVMDILQFYSSYMNLKYLIWNNIDSNGFTFVPKVYWGYYGPSLQLKVIDSSKFTQSFLLNSIMYPNKTFNCQMGYNSCYLSLTAPSPTSLFSSLSFVNKFNFSYYYQPFPIFVEFSTDVCVISIQFSQYNLFHNGQTLPIILNFAHCRPVETNPISIVTKFNSTQVFIESSLSELNVTYENPIGVIIVKHYSSNTTLKNYLMNLTLSGIEFHYFFIKYIGTFASRFLIPTSVLITKITRNQSSIQAKAPQILQLKPQSSIFQVQCNQPSTIYWTIGMYPTVHGFTGEEIQTRLLDGQVGLRTYIFDVKYLFYQNFRNQITEIYNMVLIIFKKQILGQILLQINQVVHHKFYIFLYIGNSTFSFKYFCQNIKGQYSGGKLINFNTPQSPYSFLKITLGFYKPLNYSTVNNYACAMAQTLIVPYDDVMSSVNSNCRNPHLIFYKGYNVTVWDQKRTEIGKNMFYYNFYIDSMAEYYLKIISKAKDSLRNATRIIRKEVPFWDNFNMYFFYQLFNLSQNTQPDIINPIIYAKPQLQITSTQISIKFPIYYQKCLVILGVISLYFNATTMAIPQTYLMKQGKFSTDVEFDNIFMNYTTGNITFVTQNLKMGTNYSLFYFVTVDDPKINAKFSKVQYINLKTLPALSVDLFEEFFKKYNWIIVFIGLSIFFNQF